MGGLVKQEGNVGSIQAASQRKSRCGLSVPIDLSSLINNRLDNLGGLNSLLVCQSLSANIVERFHPSTLTSLSCESVHIRAEMIAPTQLHILVMLRLDVLRISTRSQLSDSFFPRSLLHKVSQVSHLDGACLYILQSSCSSHTWDWGTQLAEPKRRWCKEKSGRKRSGGERQRQRRMVRREGRWEVGKTNKEKGRDGVEDDADLLPLDQPVPQVSEMVLSCSLCYTWNCCFCLTLGVRPFPCLFVCFRMNKRLRPKRRAFLTELVRTSLPAPLYSKAALTYGEERGSFLHLHLCCCLQSWSFQTGVVLPLEAGCQDLISTSCHVVAVVLVVVLSV